MAEEKKKEKIVIKTRCCLIRNRSSEVETTRVGSPCICSECQLWLKEQREGRTERGVKFTPKPEEEEK